MFSHVPEFLILIFEKGKEKERREKKKEEEKKDLLIDTLFCFMDLIIIIFVRKGTYAFENKLRMKTKLIKIIQAIFIIDVKLNFI